MTSSMTVVEERARSTGSSSPRVPGCQVSSTSSQSRRCTAQSRDTPRDSPRAEVARQLNSVTLRTSPFSPLKPVSRGVKPFQRVAGSGVLGEDRRSLH